MTGTGCMPLSLHLSKLVVFSSISQSIYALLLLLSVPHRNVLPCAWTGIWMPGTLCPEHTTPGYRGKGLTCEHPSHPYLSSGCCLQQGPAQCSIGGVLWQQHQSAVVPHTYRRAEPVDFSHYIVFVDIFIFALRNSLLHCILC